MKREVLLFLALASVTLLGGQASAVDNVMFSYQGRVRVQGQAFDGSGQFKFAIINNNGTISLWSNDLTSVGGGEPATSVPLDVTDGVFSVLVGDASLGMALINSSVFNSPNQIKLRIWFSDGVHGFQHLQPDRNLVNAELLGTTSSSGDFTIYVNGATGSDDNNGLSPAAPKKTIQAAVDALPDRLRCNVTVDVADGVYREQVNVYGITVAPGKSLIFQGDETWTSSSPSDPAVRVTGNDNDATGTAVRSSCILSRNSFGLIVRGFLLDGASGSGFYSIGGDCSVQHCKATQCPAGFRSKANAYCNYLDCLGTGNNLGFAVTNNCSVVATDCSATSNSLVGFYMREYTSASFYNSGNFSQNTDNGMEAHHMSRAWFANGYVGHMDNNGARGLEIRYNSYTEDATTKNSFVGNTLGPYLYDTGSVNYN